MRPADCLNLFLTLVLGSIGVHSAWAQGVPDHPRERVQVRPQAQSQSKMTPVQLNAAQAQAFRSWFLTILADEVDRGPNPRWVHRDCAGLVRFAVHEAFRSHDLKWKKANGFLGRPLPPEITLSSDRKAWVDSWRQVSGKRGAFVEALALIQGNTHFVSKDVNDARPGDLLFFDQGDDQHLMVWSGRSLIYHTGRVRPHDNGLRRISISQFMNWKDTRWRPTPENPNFIGFFRFSFLPR